MRCSALVLIAVAACGGDDASTQPTEDSLKVSFDTTPAAVTNQTTVTFTWSVGGTSARLRAETPITFTCTLDGGAPETCSSPHLVAAPQEGAHELDVVASQDGVTGATAKFTWTVDVTPPDTTITNGPQALTNSNLATFEFTGTGDSFACSVDNATFAACTSPAVITVVDGPHVFAVRAVDAATNVDGSPAQQSWTSDTTAPELAITAGPSGPISLATVTYSFSAGPDAAKVECAIDGAFAACVSPFSSATLAQGAHTFAVRAIDAAGNVAMQSRDFTVDTVAPTIAITAGPSGATNVAQPAFGFTVDGSPTVVQCRIDSGTAVDCVATFTPATALAEGDHVFTVTAFDAAGNTATATRAFTIDLVGPTVAIVSGPSGTIATATATFAFTVGGDVATVDCQLDAGAFAACTSPFTTGTLADGAHAFVVRARDAAGNATTAQRSFTVDTQTPTIAITAGPSGAVNTATVMFAFTVTGTPTVVECKFDSEAYAPCVAMITRTLAEGAHVLSIHVADAAGHQTTVTRNFSIDLTSPIVAITGGPNGTTPLTAPQFTFSVSDPSATATCKLDAGSPVACTSPFTTNTLGGGAHTLLVTATDAAGNTGSASRSFTVDTSAPSVVITTAPSDPTNQATPTFVFTTGSATNVTCQLDGAAPTACTSPFTTVALAEGGHSFEVTGCDSLARCANDLRTFTVDLTPPVVTVTNGPIDPDPSPIAAPTFTFVVGGALTVQCRVDSAAFEACVSPFTTAALPDGAHALVIQAVDGATNTTTVTRNFTVDTTPPAIAITGGPTGPTKNSVSTFTFTVGTASQVTCAIDAAPFAACVSPFTTTALADGDHAFAIQATDTAGNTATASRNFTVDTVVPVISLVGPGTSPPTNAQSPTFAFTISADGTQPTQTTCQLDGGFVLACNSPYNAGALADGAHSLVITATDPAGNVGSINRAFTVDTQKPVVSITSPVPAYTQVSRPSIVFTATDASTVTTRCAVDSDTPVACNIAFVAPVDLADGPHAIHVIATDAAGNSETVNNSFVVDLTPPVITIVTGPPAVSANQLPSWTFTIVETNLLNAVCRIDAQAAVACTTMFTAPMTVAAGPHTFSITAFDAAQNSTTKQSSFEVAICGDGTRTGTETCEGTDLGTHTCASSGNFDNGTLKCSASCALDVSGCTKCGNNVLEMTEDCDGSMLGGESCTALGFTGGGTLGCSASCRFDEHMCVNGCGNAIIENSEVCDAENLSGKTCASLGLPSGTLKCDADCGGYDTSGCTGGFVAENGGHTGSICDDCIKLGSGVQGGIVAGGDAGYSYAALPDYFSAGDPAFAWAITNGTTVTNKNFIGVTGQPDGPPIGAWALASGSLPDFYRGQNLNQGSIQAFKFAPYQVYSWRAGTSSNNIMGGLHPTLGSVVMHGGFQPPPNAGTIVNPLSTTGNPVNGPVWSIATGTTGVTSDVYAAVYGTRLDGVPVTGAGIYYACDINGTAGGTFTERDRGFSDADRKLIWRLLVDPASFTSAAHQCGSSNPGGYATTYYAALMGGSSIYKTTDGGANWAPSNTGLPTGAKVYAITMDCQFGGACNNNGNTKLWAATDVGIYASLDSGAHWAIAGLKGQDVRSIQVIPSATNSTPGVIAATSDAAIYRLHRIDQ